jgi:hypothetical protein
MEGFEPEERWKKIVFESLPCRKEDLISILKVEGLSEKEARSLIWNMKHRAYIYTSVDEFIKKM